MTCIGYSYICSSGFWWFFFEVASVDTLSVATALRALGLMGVSGS